MPISNEWDVDFTSLIVSHQDGRLIYDGGNGKAPGVDMAVTGSTSGATAVALTASDGSTAAAGTLFLTDVQDGVSGPFLNNEGVTGSNDFSASMSDELIFTKQAYIDYDALEVNFSSSDFGTALTGGLSAATAEIADVRVDIQDVTGRLFLVNVSGVFTDNEPVSGSTGGIAIANTGSVFASLEFDAQTTSFNLNTILTGTTSFASASIVGIRDKGAKGTLFLGPITGAFIDNEPIVDSGGTPGSGTSNGLATFVTVQWPSNRLYSFLQDTFDELSAMDDTVPWSAQVKNQQYTKINAWTTPTLSTRFLKKGSIQTSSLGEIWTDYQTLGTIVEDPLLYVEQSGSVLTSFWDRGQFDILLRNKTANALIDAGAVTIFAREYGTLYDNFRTTALAGASPIPLATAVDLNNTTDADITRNYDNVGLIFVNNDLTFFSGAFGGALPVETDIVYNSASEGSGYVLSSSTTGDSGTLVLGNVTGTLGSADDKFVLLSSLKFKFQSSSFVQNQVLQNASASPTASGTIVRMEQIGGVVGRVYLTDVSASENFTDDIDVFVGATRFATASGTMNVSGTWLATGSLNINADTVHKNIGDGNGDQPYDAILECSGATLLQTYERTKFLTRDLSLDFVDTVQGRLYISANTGSYSPVKPAPVGTFAGGTMFAARGIFLQNMDAADIRNFQLTDASGTIRNPPNLQTISVTSLVSGDRVTVFPLSASTDEIFKNQYAATGDGGGTVLTVDEQIQTETPAAGVVRIIDTSFDYNSFVAGPPGIFTLDSAHGGTTAGDQIYVPFIEEEAAGTSVSVNVVHATDRGIKIRVRKKGILPFEVDSTFTATGASVAAIRTTDTIVDP